jgi:hypothetical protein
MFIGHIFLVWMSGDFWPDMKNCEYWNISALLKKETNNSWLNCLETLWSFHNYLLIFARGNQSSLITTKAISFSVLFLADILCYMISFPSGSGENEPLLALCELLFFSWCPAWGTLLTYSDEDCRGALCTSQELSLLSYSCFFSALQILTKMASQNTHLCLSDSERTLCCV